MVIHTIIHIAAFEPVDAGKFIRRSSTDSNHIVVISGAFQSVTMNILFITLFIPVRVKGWFTTGGPLNAIELMTSPTVESPNEMPGWTKGPAFPKIKKKNRYFFITLLEPRGLILYFSAVILFTNKVITFYFFHLSE